MASAPDVTLLLHRAREGDDAAMDRLVPLIYDELRAMAHQKLRYERADHTLNTTGLVHEAYLKLSNATNIDWQNRTHFFALASRSMRRILINYAEQRRTLKRGGTQQPLRLDDPNHALTVLSDDTLEHVLVLDEALTRLAAFNPRGAQVVEYRYFVGLTYDEIAEVMNLSSATVRRAWDAARAWLRRELATEV
ncbi:MAG: sigma-70 family RNA polymerase sigma factor [Rhodothermales bacterium]